MVWGLKRFGPSLKWPVGIRLGTTQLYWNMIKITMTYEARPTEEARRLRLALFLAVVWCTTAEILLFSKYHLHSNNLTCCDHDVNRKGTFPFLLCELIFGWSTSDAGDIVTIDANISQLTIVQFVKFVVCPAETPVLINLIRYAFYEGVHAFSPVAMFILLDIYMRCNINQPALSV